MKVKKHGSQSKFLTLTLSASLVTVLTLSSVSAMALAADGYQQNVLFAPSEQQLDVESRGRVMIYDGLKDEVVERAMSEQFKRIENMMFVRIQYVQEDGSIETDDDCD